MKKKLGLMLLAIFMLALQLNPNVIRAESASRHVGEIMDVILDKYKGQVTREQLEQAAIQGIFSILDENSKYYGDNRDMIAEPVDKDYVGIGVKLVKREGGIVVDRVIKGGSAEKAGLAEGDELLSVDEKSLDSIGLHEAAALFAGSEGTAVEVTVRRNGELIALSIVRETIKADPASIRKVEQVANGIKYMEIQSFNQGVYDAFNRILRQSRADGTQGLIIDLRNNKGGLLSEVIRMCQEVIPTGPIAYVVDKNGKEVKYESSLPDSPFEIVVLVNEVSASASEIFASSVQESGAGVVIGERTFGKGTVQQVFKDAKGKYFKVTTAEYLTRNKKHIHGIGLAPDVEINVPSSLQLIEHEFEAGDRHAAVKDIEGMLDFLGYGIEQIDDVYDRDSARAVAAFQKDNGLAGEGRCDIVTQKALNTRLHEKLKEEDIQLTEAIRYLIEKLTADNA